MPSRQALAPSLPRAPGIVLRLLRRLARGRARERPRHALPVRMLLAVTGLLGAFSEVSVPEAGATDVLPGWMFAAAAVGAAGMARVARHTAGLEGVRLPATAPGAGWGSWTRCTRTVPLPGAAAGRRAPAVICHDSRPCPDPGLR